MSDCGTVTITPAATFDPSLVEAVGCSVSPRTFAEDDTLTPEGTVTVQNNNAEFPAIAAISWFVNDQFLVTNPNLGEQFAINADGQNFITVSLPTPANWPVDPGEGLEVRAVVESAEQAPTAVAPVNTAPENTENGAEPIATSAPIETSGCGCGCGGKKHRNSILNQNPTDLLSV